MSPLLLALAGLAQAQDIDGHGFHPTTTAPDQGHALSLAAPARDAWGGLLLDIADDPLVEVSATPAGAQTETVAIDSLWTANLGGGFRPVDPLQLYAVFPIHLVATGEATSGAAGDLALGATAWGLESDAMWLGFSPSLRLPTASSDQLSAGRAAWAADVSGGLALGPTRVGLSTGLGSSDQPLSARVGASVGWIASNEVDLVAELHSQAALAEVRAWGPRGEVPRYRGEALLSARWNPRPVGVIAGIGRGLAKGPGSANVRAVLGISWVGTAPQAAAEPVPEPEAVVDAAPVVEPEPVPEPADLEVPLTVRVTDLKGQPLRATIRLEGPTEQPDLAASPDRDGVVSTELAPGEWTLTLWSDGYAGQRVPVELIDEPVSMELALGPTKVRIEETEVVILEQVHFDTDKATIKPDSFPLLEDVAVSLISRPHILQLEVQGHTDHRGSDAYNLRLSQARVDSVVERLLHHGVEAHRLVPVGYGESQPIASNETAEGMASNRRVQFVILRQEAPQEPPAPTGAPTP